MNNIPKKSNRLIGVWALILVFSMMLSLLLAGCGDSGDNSSEASSAESSVAESSAVSDETSEDSSEPDDSSDESDASVEDSSEAEESSETESGADESSIPDTSNDESSEVPEVKVLGSGTKDDPYLTSISEDMKIETVSIPAGKSVFYDIYRIGGTILTVNSKNAYIVYNGEKYTPENGKIVINIEEALAHTSISFEIGNTAKKAESVVLTFAYPKGSLGNPEKVSKITDKNTIALEAGDEYGYTYKYVAEKKGTIRFYMTATADSVLIVTNNRNSAQRTTESDPQTDENGNTYVEIEVKKGDTLIINVAAVPNRRGKIPATEITWNGEYN